MLPETYNRAYFAGHSPCFFGHVLLIQLLVFQCETNSFNDLGHEQNVPFSSRGVVSVRSMMATIAFEGSFSSGRKVYGQQFFLSGGKFFKEVPLKVKSEKICNIKEIVLLTQIQFNLL